MCVCVCVRMHMCVCVPSSFVSGQLSMSRITGEAQFRLVYLHLRVSCRAQVLPQEDFSVLTYSTSVLVGPCVLHRCDYVHSN